MLATGSPPRKAIRNPSGSAAWKHSASSSPGFQPSAAAQSTASSSSARDIDRISSSSVAFDGPIVRSLAVELGVPSKDAVLVEGDAALAREISGDARTLRHRIVQGDHGGAIRRRALRGDGERVSKPLDDLKQGQIGIGELRADEVAGTSRIA